MPSDAIERIRAILLDPAGKTVYLLQQVERFGQGVKNSFSYRGHYEGHDERIKTLVTDEISCWRLCLDWWRTSSNDYD